MMKRGVVGEAIFLCANAFPNAAKKQNGEKEKEKDGQKKKGRRLGRSHHVSSVYLSKWEAN